MMWHCLKLVRYWKDVIKLIKSIFSISFEVTYIFGCVEYVAVENEVKIPIAKILYVARKVIAQWLDTNLPTVQEFINKVS